MNPLKTREAREQIAELQDNLKRPVRTADYWVNLIIHGTPHP